MSLDIFSEEFVKEFLLEEVPQDEPVVEEKTSIYDTPCLSGHLNLVLFMIEKGAREWNQ